MCAQETPFGHQMNVQLMLLLLAVSWVVGV